MTTKKTEAKNIRTQAMKKIRFKVFAFLY